MYLITFSRVADKGKQLKPDSKRPIHGCLGLTLLQLQKKSKRKKKQFFLTHFNW